MTTAEIVGHAAANVSALGALFAFLWKGLLPEVRAMRRELTAIEKHLAAAGQARVHLEGAVKGLVEDVQFLVSARQSADGRTTRPGDPEVIG